jgi:hypothetical protein
MACGCAAGWRFRLCRWQRACLLPRLANSRNDEYYQRIGRNHHSSIYPVLLWLLPARNRGHRPGLCWGWRWPVRRAEPLRAAFLLIGAVLLLAPNGYSWYFTWIVPLLCFFPSPAWLLLTVLQFLSYKVWINYRAFGQWQFDPLFQWLTYAPFYALLAWEIFRRRSPGSSGLNRGEHGKT